MLTDDEVLARDRRIAQARAAGEPVRAIAEREGITDRSVRRAVRRHNAAAAADLDTESVVLEIIGAHLEALANLRGIRTQGARETPHFARAVAAVGTSLVNILDRVGQLPGAESMRDAQVVQTMAEEFIGVLVEHRIEEQAAAQAVERVQERWMSLGLRTRVVADRQTWLAPDETERRRREMRAMLARVQGGQVSVEEALSEISEHDAEPVMP